MFYAHGDGDVQLMTRGPVSVEPTGTKQATYLDSPVENPSMLWLRIVSSCGTYQWPVRRLVALK